MLLMWKYVGDWWELAEELFIISKQEFSKQSILVYERKRGSVGCSEGKKILGQMSGYQKNHITAV